MKDDLKEKLSQHQNWIVIVIVLSVLLAGIYTLFSSSGSALPGYVDQPKPPEEPSPLNILETVLYTDERIGLTVGIPDGWQKIVRGGFDTFVHPDGSSMQLQIMDYSPSINMVTPDSIASDVQSIGGVLSEFLRISTSSYIIVYKIGDANYIEMNIWDRQVLARIQFTLSDENYGIYFDTCMNIINTLIWERLDPIPADFALYFSEFGGFEFGIPIAWNYVITEDGVLAATNPHTGTVMYVSVIATDNTFHGVSQIEYVQVMGANRNSFLLQSFTNDGNAIAAEATYYVGETQYGLAQYRVSTGWFQYAFSFEAQIDVIQQDLPFYQTAIRLFRF